MNADFIFKMDKINNEELKIISTYTRTNGGVTTDYIYLKKYSIPWIITTLRNMNINEYNEEIQRTQIFPEYLLKLRFNIIEKGYSWLDIFPCWKDDKKFSLIEIPYLSFNENLLMGEFIEPFLTALEKYVSEEERAKLPKPWPDNMTREQWEEYRKNKPKGNGKSKITFVKEIKPEDYFK